LRYKKLSVIIIFVVNTKNSIAVCGCEPEKCNCIFPMRGKLFNNQKMFVAFLLDFISGVHKISEIRATIAANEFHCALYRLAVTEVIL